LISTVQAKGKKPMRVLVVDDDRDGADTLGMVMGDLGNQVHVTYGGTQALDVATAFRPDIMLIDLVMPSIDGCWLVERFRSNPAFAQTRIVAITGYSDEEHKSSAMKAGFDTVLVKPVTLPTIEAVLASIVPSVAPADQPPRLPERASRGQKGRLPIGEA
jgi:CheY-like chemotaxis protein